jgi:hypothetical protein
VGGYFMDSKMCFFLRVFLYVLCVWFIYPEISNADLKRGLQNYLDILNGKKTIQQLPPNEAQEVFFIHQKLQGSLESSPSTDTYEIQASVNDEWFIINNKKYQAKTYCFSFDKGDRVKFITGSPNSSCVSAKILNLRNDKMCDVWCE